MCRATALTYAKRFEDMRKAGVSRIVAVVKEDIQSEVDDFKKGFWSEDVFVDRDMVFYKALGGGEARQPNGLCGFMRKALCPCGGSPQLKANLASAKLMGVEQNMKGEGFVTGGMYVLRSDGRAAFSFFEDEYGDRADLDKVVSAIQNSG